jgi:lysine biosynthesis protein LysW
MVRRTAIKAECPECGSTIPLPRGVKLWMEIRCPHCRAGLEVVNDEPWELDFLYGDEQEDDWDDEWDDDEEEEDDNVWEEADDEWDDEEHDQDDDF